MCPHCNRLVEKAKYCNHLTCTFCMVSFCILCRKNFTANHMNPFHAFVCEALVLKKSKILIVSSFNIEKGILGPDNSAH